MICLTLSDPTLEECVKTTRKNRAWIEAVELRLDFLTPEERSRSSEFPSMVDLPVICTHRRTQDGGKYEGSEKQRKNEILKALDGNFSYVDIEDDVKKCEIDEKARAKGIKIIRSFHDFTGIPNDIYSRVLTLKKRGDIAKIAVTPQGILDTITLFNAEKELKDVPKIIIGMGPYGVATRILYRRMGSILTFASDSEAAPGQLKAKDLKELYHADEVNDRTAIYGIIGNPVNHSSSPRIHNPGFRAIKYNAIYVPFLVDNARAFFALAENLHMRGFSVTVPHKVEVLSYLGNITREVKQIGSCNTVVRTPGLWKGMNTDYYGFLIPILPDIESGRIKNALVIGAGGASYAIVWALRNWGVKVTILNRTLSHAEKIAKINICAFDKLENAKNYEGQVDLIVQTTSVGLNTFESPIEGFKFSGREIAYDIVYKPHMTKFLTDAKAAGCTLHFGDEMLLEQGKLQFEAFTGYHYPANLKPDV
ncbi:MAG: type I 3-dehydroquinate dehydratase [Bullifex sp.]